MRVDEQRKDVLISEAHQSLGNTVLLLSLWSLLILIAAELQLSLCQRLDIFLSCLVLPLHLLDCVRVLMVSHYMTGGMCGPCYIEIVLAG